MGLRAPELKMMTCVVDDDEIIYCEHCLEWGKDGKCEVWGKTTTSFGFCHMAVDKSRAGEYEKWKRLEETKKRLEKAKKK